MDAFPPPSISDHTPTGGRGAAGTAVTPFPFQSVTSTPQNPSSQFHMSMGLSGENTPICGGVGPYAQTIIATSALSSSAPPGIATGCVVTETASARAQVQKDHPQPEELVLRTSLEAENDILRSEVHALLKLVAELRAKIPLQPTSASSSSSLSANGPSVSKTQPFSSTSTPAMQIPSPHDLQLAITEREARIAQLKEENQSLRGQYAELHKMMSMASAHVEKIASDHSQECQRHIAILSGWEVWIRGLTKQLLPTFDQDVSPQLKAPPQSFANDKNDNSSSIGVEDLLGKVEDAIRTLLQVVSARTESSAVLTARLKEDRYHIQQQLDRSLEDRAKLETEFLESQKKAEITQFEIRQQVKQLQTLYASKLEETENRLIDVNQRMQFYSKCKTDLERELETVHQQLQQATEKIAEMELNLEQQEQVYTRVQAQFVCEQQRNTQLAEQLRALKTQHKLVGLVSPLPTKANDPRAIAYPVKGNPAASDVPIREKADLLRVIDKLLLDNSRLQEQLDGVHCPLSTVQRKQIQPSLPSNVPYGLAQTEQPRWAARKVDLILNDRIPEYELTRSIFLQNRMEHQKPATMGLHLGRPEKEREGVLTTTGSFRTAPLLVSGITVKPSSPAHPSFQRFSDKDRQLPIGDVAKRSPLLPYSREDATDAPSHQGLTSLNVENSRNGSQHQLETKCRALGYTVGQMNGVFTPSSGPPQYSALGKT